MAGQIPKNPKIYHIVHMDRLESIISDGFLYSYAKVKKSQLPGTNIGMETIKERRLGKTFNSQPSLHVGNCVPFYFCPRSVMLYMFYKKNHPEIAYRGGQEPIVHLQADLYHSVNWADQNNKKWAFTKSNAGSYYFEDFNDLSQLNQINWNAVNAKDWRDCQEPKQAEFLIEEHFPWFLVDEIGVYSEVQKNKINAILHTKSHQPPINIHKEWYY